MYEKIYKSNDNVTILLSCLLIWVFPKLCKFYNFPHTIIEGLASLLWYPISLVKLPLPYICYVLIDTCGDNLYLTLWYILTLMWFYYIAHHILLCIQYYINHDIYTYIYLLMCWQRIKTDKLKIRCIKSSFLAYQQWIQDNNNQGSYSTERQARLCLGMKHTIHSGFSNWHITLITSLGITHSVTIAQFVNPLRAGTELTRFN